MSSKEKPHNYNLEKTVLGGVLKYPQVWPEIRFLSEEDFFSAVKKRNKVIFNIIRNELEKNNPIDTVILAEKINSIGINAGDGEVIDYLDALKITEITERGLIQAAKDLKLVSVRRMLFEDADKIQKYITSNEDDSIDKIISKVDSINNSRISSIISIEREPINLCEDLSDFIEDTGNNPRESLGLIAPWHHWNKLYGGFRLKDSYGFAGRAKDGKSTILMDLAWRMGNVVNQDKAVNQEKIPILYFDTEQEENENRFKLAACIANVSPALIESGKWRFDAESVSKVRKSLKEIDDCSYYHIYTPRLSVDEIRSLALRWYHQKVGRGNPAIICYDYVKLSGDDLAKTTKEYLAAAHKLDVLKDMVKEEMNATLLFGVQRNRSGVGKEASDDESSISLSDNLVQLAAYMAIIKRKTPEEIAEETLTHGTHKLITLTARKQGFEGKGFADIIKFKGKWTKNFLNMNIENYRVEEVSTGQELADFLDLKSSEEDGKNKKVKAPF